MLKRLFGGGREPGLGERLYAAAVAQARDPRFYAELGAPDRIDARFELYTLHVLLLVMRLRDGVEGGVEAGQSLFDAYVSALDDTLRELGVGDVSVPKKMRRLGEQLYGRMSTYEPLLRDGDEAGLAGALARNLFERDAADAESRAVAAYALAARAMLKEQPTGVLMAGEPCWPDVAGKVAAA